MCRIIGGFDSKNSLTINIVNEMRDTMTHGGPDSAGTYFENGLALAHRRLSIIDLSESGNQPMVFENWIIVFNGEIYNYKEIKQILEDDGVNFKTETDTEVILKAFQKWGTCSVNKFRGMFAFAIFDKLNEELWICRDRFGVKPLYWYFKDGVFLFSSEIKGLLKYPFVDKTIDTRGIPHYLMKGYFAESDCIFKYIRKVQPGCFLKVNKSNCHISHIKYWDLLDKYHNRKVKNSSEDLLAEELEELLNKSFSLRTVSDVPIGIFLSGGIDSSLVASFLQKNSNKDLNTYTVGFEDAAFNESVAAKEIAERLGTNHNTLICDEKDFLNVVALLPKIYDEPFGDSSAIPTYLLSKYASKHVKVALSGDGADELFGGYAKYRFVYSSINLLKIPGFIRSGLSSIVYNMPMVVIKYLLANSGVNSYTQIESKFYKFRQTIDSANTYDLFQNASSYLSKKEINALTNKMVDSSYCIESIPNDSLLSYMGLMDMNSYLPSDILTKVDRASMSVGLEAREPFLDPEILEFSLSIPNEFKITKNGESKYLLRKLLKKHLPSEIVNLPKYGFSIPIEKWMKNHLKDDVNFMQNDFVFFGTFQLSQKEVNIMCNNFFSNKKSQNPYVLWFILCLHKWYKYWL